MARLVIVSNRVSQPGARSERAGGLAIAMREALRHSGGLWFGWSGETAEASSSTPHVVTAGGITYATVDLGKADHHEYYVGYANSTLWPLLHFRLGLISYRRHAFERYRHVNQHLARTLAPLLRSDDLVWVHDYHLIPFAAELRDLGIANRIGFFLHTPLPPPEILTALPHHGTLMRALCAYDLIGFQTKGSVRAFLNYIAEPAGGRHLGEGRFVAFGMRSRAGAFPIGIDTEPFARTAERAETAPETQRLRESLAGRELILGVDRLDYSKGIPNRFEAIDSLLSDRPHHRSRFHYLQVTPHSRAEVAQYRTLRREIEAAAGRVNGKFAEFDWTPIRYVNKSLSRQTLAGFYRIARIGLVTPLRDGMNLVAKEYVAAQDPGNPGVLVLSCFAGAASELDAALLVNPIDVDDIASAIDRGLAMPLAERRERWNAMIGVLRKNDITAWRESFLAALLDRGSVVPLRSVASG
ncbi:MAG: alpha,alpha-trehalose-phosphate synthase (UDP-forming) [Proteobacteria bacterium]|nr:alpha,alpha-trehalose-phosphate synthase (UDP-forming) [Pseudomonadota bacterium]